MKLLVQPEAGVAPIVTAIKKAKKSVDILIFRHDRNEITQALEAAVARGVNVRALIAHTNRGGDRVLRKLELRLLAAGVTVSRTADDLVRYHGKMMIIDAAVLHVYGFNLTALDIEKSRSFGIVTRNKRVVAEAMKLYEADTNRQPYVPGAGERFIVSPETSRARLAAFINGAKKQLLIYDPNLSDDRMLKLITEKLKAGVEVRVLGKVEAKWDVPWEKFPGKRLHVRAIIRDGSRAFVGSQSLRKLELDKRREVGVIVQDEAVLKQMMMVFAKDWYETPTGKAELKKADKAAEKGEKKGAKEPRALAAAM